MHIRPIPSLRLSAIYRPLYCHCPKVENLVHVDGTTRKQGLFPIILGRVHSFVAKFPGPTLTTCLISIQNDRIFFAANIGPRHGSQSDANDSSVELTGSWWGCYLRSSVPSVAAVYATLRRQSARFCCRSPASSPSTLHVSWARTSPCTEPRFQEPARSCFLLAFYAKLSQASTRVWPVIDTSLRSPVGTGRDAVGFQRRPDKRCSPVFTQNKHYEKSLVNPTYAGCELSFTPGLSSLLLVTSVRFPLFL